MFKQIYYRIYRILAASKEKDSRLGGAVQNLVRKEALAFVNPQIEKILELGCGDGFFLTQLAKEHLDSIIWGIDINQDYLNKANDIKKRCNFTNMNVVYNDARNLDFNEDYFDTVICINFILNLENIQSVEEVFLQMKRVCKPGGSIVFEFRNSLNLLFVLKYKLAKYYDGTLEKMCLNTYRLKQFRELLDRLNLKIVKVKNIGFPNNRFSPIIMIEAIKV